jgi:hypothetical protein
MQCGPPRPQAASVEVRHLSLGCGVSPLSRGPPPFPWVWLCATFPLGVASRPSVEVPHPSLGCGFAPPFPWCGWPRPPCMYVPDLYCLQPRAGPLHILYTHVTRPAHCYPLLCSPWPFEQGGVLDAPVRFVSFGRDRAPVRSHLHASCWWSLRLVARRCIGPHRVICIANGVNKKRTATNSRRTGSTRSDASASATPHRHARSCPSLTSLQSLDSGGDEGPDQDLCSEGPFAPTSSLAPSQRRS